MAEMRENDVNRFVGDMVASSERSGPVVVDGSGNAIDLSVLPDSTRKAIEAELRKMDVSLASKRKEQVQAAKLADTKDISELDKAKQADILKSVMGMVADNEAAKAQVAGIAKTLGIVMDPPKAEPVIPRATTPPPAAPPPATPEPKAAEAVTEGHVAKRCPNCTWPLDVDPVEITNEDKTRWLRSILGGVAFVKEYPLMGGSFILTFRTRTVGMNSQIYDQLAREIRDGKIVSSELMTGISLYNFRARKLQFAASVLSASGLALNLPEVMSQKSMLELPLRPEVKEMVEKRFACGDNAIAIYHDALFAHWGEPVYMMAFKEFEKFELTCLRLVEAATCSDFWTGIGAAV